MHLGTWDQLWRNKASFEVQLSIKGAVAKRAEARRLVETEEPSASNRFLVFLGMLNTSGPDFLTHAREFEEDRRTCTLEERAQTIADGIEAAEFVVSEIAIICSIDDGPEARRHENFDRAVARMLNPVSNLLHGLRALQMAIAEADDHHVVGDRWYMPVREIVAALRRFDAERQGLIERACDAYPCLSGVASNHDPAPQHEGVVVPQDRFERAGWFETTYGIRTDTLRKWSTRDKKVRRRADGTGRGGLTVYAYSVADVQQHKPECLDD
jgi:hypothetical protein